MILGGHAEGVTSPCCVMNSEHGFGVTCSLKRVGRMVGTKGLVIVDFTVQDHDRSLCTRHGLLTGLQVNDGQSCVSEADVLVQPNSVFIGSSMLLEAVHALEDGDIGVAEHTSNATHKRLIPTVPFEGMFRFNGISLPKWILEHDHSQEDDGDCKGHSVCDLWGVRVSWFVRHVLH